MKKLVLLFSAIFMATAISFAQNDCTLEIGSVDISALSAGEYVDIPVTMPQVDGVVMGWEFYILFDNSMFTATTTLGDPNYFLQNKTALFPGQWFENINVEVNPGQNQFAANWLDPLFVGVAVPPTEVLFNLRLMYNGGLNAGEQSDMVWNFSNKKANNYQIKGITAVVNGAFAFYNIIPIDGGVFLPGGGVSGLWTGAIDGDWFNPGNWDDGNVPTAVVDVFVPATATNMPMIMDAGTNGTAEINELLVEAGASLSVEFDGELTTNGLFTNDGMFMIMSESGSGNSGSYMDMGGIAGAGTFEFQRDIPCIGTLPGTGDPFGWHYLAAPIDGLTTDDIPDFFVNEWNQALGEWVQYTAATPCTQWPTTPLNVMDAWSVNIDNLYPYPECPGSPAPNGPMVSFMGAAADVHTGPYSKPLGYGATGYQMWNMVANPYPSGLDLNTVSWGANTVQGAAFYDGCAGNYVYWSPAAGAYSMAPTLGFFVETTGADNFSVDNSNRAHGPDWFWKNEVTDLLTLEATGNETSDKLHVRFMDNTTAGFDNNGDFHKLFATTEGLAQIYTTAGEHQLAINALPATDVVPMGFVANSTGTYTIKAIETSEFSEVYLEDVVTGEVTDLLTASYTFEYTLEDDADRFLIHFAPVGVGENLMNSVSIWSNENTIFVSVPNELRGTISVINMMGQEVVNTDIQPGVTNKIPMNNVNTYYVVKVLSNSNVLTGKVYIK